MGRSWDAIGTQLGRRCAMPPSAEPVYSRVFGVVVSRCAPQPRPHSSHNVRGAGRCLCLKRRRRGRAAAREPRRGAIGLDPSYGGDRVGIKKHSSLHRDAASGRGVSASSLQSHLHIISAVVLVIVITIVAIMRIFPLRLISKQALRQRRHHHRHCQHRQSSASCSSSSS